MDLRPPIDRFGLRHAVLLFVVVAWLAYAFFDCWMPVR